MEIVKPFEHPIVEMIKRLDRGQVRYVRGQLPSKQLRLFDFFAKRKNFGTRENVRQAVETTDAGLDALCVDLQEKVLSLVGQYDDRDKPEGRIGHFINLAKGYAQLEQHEKAREYFDRARSEAFAVGRYEQALQIESLIRISLPDNLNNDSDVKMLDSSDLMREVAAELSTLRQLQSLTSWFTSKRKPIILKILDGLGKKPEALVAGIIRFRVQIGCHALIGDNVSIAEFFEQANHLLETNPQLLRNPLVAESTIKLTYTYAKSKDILGGPEDALAALAKMKKLFDSNSVTVPSSFLFYNHYFHLRLIRSNHNSRKFNSKVKEVEVFLAAHPALQLDHRFLIAFEIATQFFTAKDYTSALKWLKTILDFQKRKEPLFRVSNAYILELLCWLSLNNYDQLALALRRAKNSLKRFGVNQELVKLIDRTVTSILKGINPNYDTAIQFQREVVGLMDQIDDAKLVAMYYWKEWTADQIRDRTKG